MTPTDATSAKQPGALRFSMIDLMLFVAIVCAFVLPVYRAFNSVGHSSWPRGSPFTDVAVDGDAADVEFRGARYELVSINDAPTKAILTSARRRFDSQGEKRFIEDLPEVLGGMGLEPKKAVSLVLRDADGNEVHVADAPMTAANRDVVYAKRRARD
jgi:hypothetical protein